MWRVGATSGRGLGPGCSALRRHPAPPSVQAGAGRPRARPSPCGRAEGSRSSGSAGPRPGSTIPGGRGRCQGRRPAEAACGTDSSDALLSGRPRETRAALSRAVSWFALGCCGARWVCPALPEDGLGSPPARLRDGHSSGPRACVPAAPGISPLCAGFSEELDVLAVWRRVLEGLGPGRPTQALPNPLFFTFSLSCLWVPRGTLERAGNTHGAPTSHPLAVT